MPKEKKSIKLFHKLSLAYTNVLDARYALTRNIKGSLNKFEK